MSYIFRLTALVFFAGLSVSFTTTPAPARLLKCVVLDPGHGGLDPGAIGFSKKNYEKDVALSVSNKLYALLHKGYPTMKIVRTRTADAFVGLYDRADEANKQNADLFISIHCNSNASTTAHGIETFSVGVHKDDAQLDVIMKENSAILLEKDHDTKYDGFDPKSPEALIMFKLQQHAHHQQSQLLAQKIQQQLVAKTKRFDRGTKQAGFLVLWRTKMPSVLVELGFISNANEEKFLVSNEGQDHLASSLYEAVVAYQGK